MAVARAELTNILGCVAKRRDVCAYGSFKYEEVFDSVSRSDDVAASFVVAC